MIHVANIEKSFRLYRKPADRLKEILTRQPRHQVFKALDRLSFSVAEGETLGIIGRNGAGKSTLLKLLTGVLLPDAGEIRIKGKITGLLELGTGFHDEFSGRQNIFLNGTYLGLSREETAEREAEIIAFSELGDFIDEPMKTYSSGMIMRLAFAIAIHANPRAFVIDEALSVGDAYFQHKCIERIRAFKQQGGAIIFVSHDMNAVKLLCDRVLLLERGRELECGEPEAVINSYNFLIARLSQGKQLERREQGRQSEYGNLKARIRKVELTAEGLGELNTVISGMALEIRIGIEALTELPELTAGFLIRDKYGQDIFGTNSYLLGHRLALQPGERRQLCFRLPAFNLGPGKYSLTAALHTSDTHLEECYHWRDGAVNFEVVLDSGHIFTGLCRLDCSLESYPDNHQ